MTPFSEADASTSDAPVRAAGAVLWRHGDGGELEVALVHRPKYDDWSLPKGKAEDGEHPLVTAVREVAEETGFGVALGRPLPPQHYDVRDRRGGWRPKVVRYWAGRAGAGSFMPHTEVDALEWLPVETARSRLTWARDADLLDALIAAPVDTVPLVVVRHAAAAERERWAGDDALRALSPEGLAQAASLVGVLGTLGSLTVVASPTARTEATVQPYADAYGLAVRLDVRLDEPHAGTGAPRDVVRELVAARLPVVVCTHRPDLPEVAEALREAGAQLAAEDLRLAAGELLVAHLYDGRVLATERHAPL